MFLTVCESLNKKIVPDKNGSVKHVVHRKYYYPNIIIKWNVLYLIFNILNQTNLITNNIVNYFRCTAVYLICIFNNHSLILHCTLVNVKRIFKHKNFHIIDI